MTAHPLLKGCPPVRSLMYCTVPCTLMCTVLTNPSQSHIVAYTAEVYPTGGPWVDPMACSPPAAASPSVWWHTSHDHNVAVLRVCSHDSTCFWHLSRTSKCSLDLACHELNAVHCTRKSSSDTQDGEEAPLGAPRPIGA